MLCCGVLSRIASAFLIAMALVAGSWQRVASSQSPEPYLVVIVMDGFRADYQTLAPMRHLRALMARGTSYDNAWVGQLESETPTGHATIATGVYPRKHGIIGFGWRDRATGVFTYAPTDLKAVGQGYITRTMEQGGVPTLSDMVHRENPHALAISLSGEKLWASAPLGAGADYMFYGREQPKKGRQEIFRPVVVGPNMPPPSTHYFEAAAIDSSFDYQDGFAARLAVRMTRTLHPRALLVNLPAPDIAGHYYGANSNLTALGNTLRGTDYAIGQIVNEYKREGLLNRTVFVVAADHGMVLGRRRVPIHPIYDAVRASRVNEQDEELRTSMGSIWLHDPEHAASLAATLASKHFTGVESALYKVPDGDGGWKFQPDASTAAKLPANVLQAYLDLANTEASPSGPEVLLPYSEDTVGLPRSHKFHGMHGGFSWNAQHVVLVLAGPGVRHGVAHFPAQLVDIAPTVERLMRWQVPKGVDGVVLTDGLVAATSSERASQAAVQDRRMQDVNALRQHAGKEAGH